MNNDNPTLRRRLRSWHIFLIAIGSTIGIGWTKNGSEILAISGPSGTLTAFGFVGFVAICVMEGVCEMVVLWPISNAMIEYVRAFVDPDLAIVVGFTYWYTYCVTLAALIIGSTKVLSYWFLRLPMQRLTYGMCILFILLVNLLGISWFGNIEAIGGLIKVVALFSVFVAMICVNNGAGDGPIIKSSLFNAGTGFQNNPQVASSHAIAVATVIPIATFAFIGIEMVTVMAFEARNPRELRFPSKNVAYCITMIYLIVIGGYISNVEWFNQTLPAFFDQPLVSLSDPNLGSVPMAFPGNSSRSNNAPVIAMLQAGYKAIPGLITGFIFYSGISCATANLYVASRTLYGLTRDMDQHDPDRRFIRFLAKLNTVTPKTRVPIWAIILSLFIFSSWMPFVWKDQSTTDKVQQTLVSMGSVGCVLVWASQCLAFINYNRWLWRHQDRLTGRYARYNRWASDLEFTSWASSLQPVPAYLGLTLCLFIVFVLNSASMWNRHMLVFKSLTIYLAPIVLAIFFLILKVINGWRWLELGGWEQLQTTLNNLSDLENPSTDGRLTSGGNTQHQQQPGKHDVDVPMDELPPEGQDIGTISSTDGLGYARSRGTTDGGSTVGSDGNDRSNSNVSEDRRFNGHPGPHQTNPGAFRRYDHLSPN